MKMNFKIRLLSLILGLIFFSCNKDASEPETSTSLDNGLADAYFNDMHAVVNSAAADNGFAGFVSENTENKTAASDCPIVTFSEAMGVFPNTMTIDFGVGCTGYYSIERSGKIEATFTGPYSEEGTVITIVPIDYFVNGNHLEGTKTITNMGLNADGLIHFSIHVSDGKITFADGDEITWTADRDREWTEGFATAEIIDDVYSI